MTDIQLSKNFWLSELIKSEVALRNGINNYPTNPIIIDNLTLVARKLLQPCRDVFGVIHPNSGYRNEVVNHLVGSEPTSQHILGQAVDFEVVGVPNYKLATWIRDNLPEFDQLILECYTIGQPNSGWVHCSIKPTGNRMQCLTYSGGRYHEGLVE